MSGFVAHGESGVCSVMTRPGELPVVPDPRLPAPVDGQPAVGFCRDCARFGVVYEVPPLADDVAEDLLAFTTWMDTNLKWAEDVSEEHAAEHRALVELHAALEVITFGGHAGTMPARKVICRECKSGAFPCQTVRLVARIYRWGGGDGWREGWAPS